MPLKEVSINTRNWVDSAQDWAYWRALVNAALNLRVLYAMRFSYIHYETTNKKSVTHSMYLATLKKNHELPETTHLLLKQKIWSWVAEMDCNVLLFQSTILYGLMNLLISIELKQPSCICHLQKSCMNSPETVYFLY